ncbi:hypothetical protein BR93DRAFT_817201 [Coniochaeta sp. PMI_546]|nr:hypothetical protein BR93DRAFT_817201 [Coniochaeta sp. PMI_546]
MQSPVIEAIRDLVVTEFGDPFGSDILRCLGNAQPRKKGEEVRQCLNHASNEKRRKISNAVLIPKFAALNEIPHDDAFYVEVKQFIQNVYCMVPSHAAAALAKFETWKEDRTAAHRNASVNLETPAGDHTLVGTEGGTDGRSSQPNPVTPPKKSTGGKIDADEGDSAALSPGTSTASPNDESIFDLDPASPAGTDVTTPGSIPPQDSPSPVAQDTSALSGTMDESDRGDDTEPNHNNEAGEGPDSGVVGSRPQTPSPPVRQQFAHVGPLGIVKVARRPTARHVRHRQFLESITKPFHSLDYHDGHVYVWRHKTYPQFVKVGWTRRTSVERRADSENKCYRESTYDFWQSDVSLIGACRVEEIVKKQLRERNVRLKICVVCGDGHTEYFEKDAEEAKVLMEKWVKFVRGAYADGMLTEAGRRAVRAKVLDMDPDVSELAALLVSTAADEPISAVEGLVSVLEGGNAVNGDEKTPVNILVSDAQTNLTAEPDSLSLVSEGRSLPRTVPGKRVAAAVKSKLRGIDWKGKAKATVRFLTGDKSAQTENSGVPSSSRSGLRRDTGETKYNELKQTLSSVVRRVAKLEEEAAAGKQDDDLAMQRRIISWIPKPRRAATISAIAS